MSKLTDEQIEQCRQSGYTNKGLRSAFSFEKAARAIEAAATEPLLQRIAHLEATASANYGHGHADAHSMLSERIAELERQLHEQAVSLEEARKDAERWKMTIEINQDVLRHPDSRKIPASVSAYMNAIHKGYDMTYAVDAAIDAAIRALKGAKK